MAFAFGDGFDCYAATADALAGYWDGGTSTGFNFTAGRFTGSQALRDSTAAAYLVKSSGSNDAIHHIVCAFQQTTTLTGTAVYLYLQLGDGATAQCSVVFRSDGAILLTSGGPTGTTLATYTGAVSAQNTWFAFEFEVVINSTTGSFTARKNGNTSNDFTLGSLNTRGGTTNNYASRITVGNQAAAANAWLIDDLLWRSDASSVPWVGDIRCYTRMPASDVQAQFSKAPASAVITPQAAGATRAFAVGNAYYSPFTASVDGTIGIATISLSAGFTGNLKCSIFASAANVPTTVLGSATTIVNPSTGVDTLTFGTPVTVTRGGNYFIGFASDVGTGTFNCTTGSIGLTSTTSYAAFPAASPSTSGLQCPIVTLTITVGSNATLVNEAQQDGATSYVYDSNVGDNDLYSIAAISGTPTSTVCVTTRGFFEKSDANARGAAVQLKSGGTTVQSTPTLLSSSWGWLWRTDMTDPATSAAWTATGVNNALIGPIVTS